MDTEEGPSRREQLRVSLQRLGLATVAVAVVAVMAGYLFARTTPERAAATRISGFVVDERDVDVAPGGDLAAPTSGEAGGEGVCGAQPEPLTTDEQVASLRAGRVLVQYRPEDLTPARRATLDELRAAHTDVVVAPNAELAAPVVVTAWTRRMPLERPDADLIDSFLTAYGGGGPDPAPCPTD